MGGRWEGSVVVTTSYKNAWRPCKPILLSLSMVQNGNKDNLIPKLPWKWSGNEIRRHLHIHHKDTPTHSLTRSFKQAADPPLFSASFFVRPSPTAVKGSGYGTSTKQRKMGWRVTGWVVRMMSYSSVLFIRRKCSWRALLSVVLPCVCVCVCVCAFVVGVVTSS